MDKNADAARFAGAVLIGTVLLVWVYLLLVPPPRLPTTFADGTYYNSCCGLVRLSNGRGSTQQGSFKYVIEKDKVGPYVLPTDHAVIAAPENIIVLPRKPDLFIRTDATQKPRWIDIMGPQAEHRFTRR